MRRRIIVIALGFATLAGAIIATIVTQATAIGAMHYFG
jgi:hypothetical protein